MTRPRSQHRIRRYFGLALVLAAREFPGAYRGNATGAFAALAVPLAMLAVYSFVFSSLIPVRFEGSPTGAHYALFLFSGLIVWNLFADVVVRGPRLFVGSPNYIHRPQFPITLLVLAPCIAAFYRSIPWLLAYLATYWIVLGPPGWTIATAPAVLLAAGFFTFGATLLMASIGALIRDLGDFIQPAVTLLFFLSPILYPASTIAEKADWVVRINPLAPILELMRALAFDQAWPSPVGPALVLAAVIASCLLGLASYALVRDSLPDLI